MAASVFLLFDVIVCLNLLINGQLTSTPMSRDSTTSPKTNLKDSKTERLTSTSKPTTTFVISTTKNTTKDENDNENDNENDTESDDENDETENEDGEPYSEEEVALHEKASLIVGAIFVPGLLALYLCCRYVPDKVLVLITGE